MGGFTLMGGSVCINNLPPNSAQETGGNLATIASAQGASGTGIAQPTGGSGNLGFLSGIHNGIQSLLSSVSAQAVATGTSGNPANQTLSVQGNNEQLLLAPVSLTAAGTFFTQALASNGSPYTMLSLNVTAVGSGGTITVQGCNEPPSGTQTWTTLQVSQAQNNNVQSGTGGTGMLFVAVPYAYVRAILTGSITGTYTLSAFFSKGVIQNRQVSISGGNATIGSAYATQPLGISLCARTANSAVANGQIAAPLATLEGAQITKPYSIPQADWTYAAASGGIVNSTATVTLVASATGLKNYLTSLSIDHDTLGAATEIVVLDGGSTVIWRGRLQTASGVQRYDFPTPLRSATGNYLGIACITAVTGAIYVNAQGYTAS